MDFLELDALYKHLEENAENYKYDHQIGNLFQKLRDLKLERGQVEEADKAQWEIDCFNFVIQNGKLKSHFSGTDDQGQPWEYPSLLKISDKQLDYIEARLKSTSNPILMARYSRILWESPRKHIEYARTAIDSYFLLVKLFEEKDKKEPQNHYGLNVLLYIVEASFLAFKLKYRIDDVRYEFNRLVREYNLNSSSAFVMRTKLVAHMIEGKEKFPTDCFVGFTDILKELGQNLYKSGKFHNAIDIFETAYKVDRKLKTNSHTWNRCIAESYESLMAEREDSDLAATSFCQNAIDYYKRIKDRNKVTELEKIYEQLKTKQKYQTFSQEIDLQPHRENCKKIAKKLSEKKPDKIIFVLMGDKSLLPQYKHMEKKAEESSKVAVFTSIAPVSVTDEHGHTADHFTTDDEIKYFGIMQQYAFELNLSKIILIDEIILQSIKCDKLNIRTIMQFLLKNSWYGKNITKTYAQGKIVNYNWLNTIAPSLNEYFNQIQAYFNKPEYSPNMVLAIDSLALKIEGLVRDICIFSGITTSYQAKDILGRIVVREKDINWLLREDPIKALFDEDDFFFFKFVLVEKAGLNLRHKIAHCLMDYSDYCVSIMHLLLLVLLRLGKYDFVLSKSVEEKVADIDDE